MVLWAAAGGISFVQYLCTGTVSVWLLWLFGEAGGQTEMSVFIQTMKRFFLLLASKLPMILALWLYFSMLAFIKRIWLTNCRVHRYGNSELLLHHGQMPTYRKFLSVFPESAWRISAFLITGVIGFVNI